MEALQAERLRVEYLDNPLGIDVIAPRLGWIVTSERRGARQTDYRVLVATELELLEAGQGDLWDSGKTESSETQHIVYGGIKLSSGQAAYWKVQVWNENDKVSDWSEPGKWTMGLLGREQWQGQWIGWKSERKPTKETPKPNVYLRRDFWIGAGLKRATVYATALGLYRLFLNGERVGNDVFSPEWTDYHVRVQYQTYDVTDLLREGDNAAGAILGQGWYSGYIGMYGYQRYGMDPSFLMQLNLEYEDGTTTSIVSDSEWKASFGEIVSSDLQMGETIDARLKMPGWNMADFNEDDKWTNVDIMYDYRGWIVSQMSRTIRATEERNPELIRFLPDGRTIIDLGQNCAGWLRVSLTGKEGARLLFRFGEVLDANGELYTDNLRFARQTDSYICHGGGQETFEPAFTYHGYRYVEISGDTESIELGDITGIVVHSDLPETGRLVTSHPLVNRLVENIRWTQKANFMGVPTDCPQRDERHGWTGDAQIFAGTAAYNMDVSAFFAKWMVDLEDAQQPTGAYTDFAPFIFGPKTEFDNDFTYTHTASAGWADAPIIVAWGLYETYGDKRLLEKHYDSMKRWVEFNRKQHPDGIRRDVPQYGDWLSVNERPFEEVIAEFGRMVSHHSTTPYDIFSTAYMAFNAKLLADIAGVLGEESDREDYLKLFVIIRDAFTEQFIDGTGKIKGDTQTAYAMALRMDLIPEELRTAAIEGLVGKIEQAGGMATTGFHGTKFLMDVLTQAGYADVAYRLLLREEYPSWLYSVNQGATTIWERWDGWTEENGFQDPGMNSLCHYAFGSIGEWMYRNIGGIDRDVAAPGYRKLLIHPRPLGGLTAASCSYDSLQGRIETKWEVANGRFILEVTVPANVTARIVIPSAAGTNVLEGNTELSAAEGILGTSREDNDCVTVEVSSGKYRFASKMSA